MKYLAANTDQKYLTTLSNYTSKNPTCLMVHQPLINIDVKVDQARVDKRSTLSKLDASHPTEQDIQVENIL